jgi:glycosyltransferase involved in cell wall biosynthesis
MPKYVAVIPCYNHPKTIGKMVQAVLDRGLSVVVVDDGSGAECATVLDQLVSQHTGLMYLMRLQVNQGKGGAVSAGLREALNLGYTHALQIDADGQHDVADISKFLRTSEEYPEAVICGCPIYDASVPKGRLYGRYATHIWIWINTLSFNIKDSMCGFRVYPLKPVVDLINQVKVGCRMDFDPEVMVRLHWRGIRVVNVPTKIHYPQDGVSHFKVLLDNVLISKMHTRLFFGMLVRLPSILWNRLAG